MCDLGSPKHLDGSPKHLESTVNYILYIIWRACFGEPRGGGERPSKRLRMGTTCALGILGRGGEDFFKHEVERRVREGFECRTKEQVLEFYTQRGTLDVPSFGWRLTPLALAAFDGDAKALLLLAHNEPPGDGASAAAYKGYEDCLHLLKEAGCDLGQANNCGETSAHFAAGRGHEDCLRVLKKAGCDLGQADSERHTPAHVAAQNGHEACLRVLMEAGCDLGRANFNGETPAHQAARFGHEGCLRVLKEAGCDLGLATFDAAWYGHVGCLRVLKEAGCDLGRAKDDGTTPAHLAAQNGHEAFLRVLKEAGCDLGQRSRSFAGGFTPAHLAAIGCREGCLRVLKEAGCDLGQVDARGNTPAHYASRHWQTNERKNERGCLRVILEYYNEKPMALSDS